MISDLERLRQAHATMPDKDRAAFDLARFNGQDYIQIAAALGITVAEVEQRMAAAMLHLLAGVDPDIEDTPKGG